LVDESANAKQSDWLAWIGGDFWRQLALSSSIVKPSFCVEAAVFISVSH
jgi:hypothetical protein